MTSTPRRRLLTPVAVGLTASALLTGCSGDDPAPTGTPATIETTTPSATPTPPPREEAAALMSGAPRTFDATYRLESAGRNRPDAAVRVRVTRHRYRVDVTRGRSTSSLMTAPAGLVSCQLEPNDKSCLVVADPGEKPPRLFDPGIQRIFRTMAPLVAEGPAGVQIRRAGVWQGPRRYGPAQCFQVTGKVPDPGVYCFLLTGRWAGVIARAEFASGALSLRAIDGRFDAESSFVPPVKPTPLPG